MTRIRLFFYRFFLKVSKACAAIVMTFLASLLLFLGTFMSMTAKEEASYFYQTSIILLLVISLFGILYLLRTTFVKLAPKKLFIFCSIIFVFLSFYLIRGIDPHIRADAAIVYSTTIQFNKGDYTSLTQQGNYLWLYPHQLGLLTWDRFLLLFSDKVTFFFGCNMLLVLLINGLQWKIADLLFHSRLVNNYTILLSFLFLPSFFFILFVYGNLPDLFFLMLGLFAYLQFNKKSKIGWAVLSVISFSLSVLIRNNYQIFVIALLIILLLTLLQTGQRQWLVFTACLITGVLLSQQGLNMYYRHLTGQEVSRGIPKIAYVTMGLRDKSATNGFWDGYNTGLLPTNNYSYDKANKMAKEDLRQRMDAYLSNPEYAIDFFGEKVLATWTEPTFQSIWSGPLEDTGQKTHTKILNSIYQGKELYQLINLFLDVLLMLIYSFSSFFTIWMIVKKIENLKFLYPFIYLLGGFLFHLIWETKSQYTYPYVYLLLPMVAFTTSRLVKRAEDKLSKNIER